MNNADPKPTHRIDFSPAPDPICGDPNDGDWCELEPGHDGHHRADTAEWANTPAA